MHFMLVAPVPPTQLTSLLSRRYHGCPRLPKENHRDKTVTFTGRRQPFMSPPFKSASGSNTVHVGVWVELDFYSSSGCICVAVNVGNLRSVSNRRHKKLLGSAARYGGNVLRYLSSRHRQDFGVRLARQLGASSCGNDVHLHGRCAG